jgi:hypothetical protein
MPSPPPLSIVIPVASGENCLATLLEDLRGRPKSWDVVIAVPEESVDFPVFETLSIAHDCTLVASPPGRGAQMNCGATAAKSQHLCFLHADSRLDATAIKQLSRAVSRSPDALMYFDLKFAADGPFLTVINTIGVFIRSRVFHLPFGDQGLCISATAFRRLQCFDTDLRPGEDLRLVLKAQRKRIPIKPIRAFIQTSARKYARQGWLRTTATHLGSTVTEILRKREL